LKQTDNVSSRLTQTVNANAADDATGFSASWRTLQWWPALVGAGFATFVALDLFRGTENGGDLASIVAASGLVYLAAAAMEKPRIAWPAFFLSVIIITAAKMGIIGFDATWVLLGIAALLAGYGVLRGATRPIDGLPLQTIAMVLFGAVAAIALHLSEVVGAYLVAAGLFAHAAWDVYHHRVNKVVARSMAEFCFVLDVSLAVAIVIVTMRV
jgi:predicted transporter